MKKTEIDIPIYPFRFWIITTDDFKKANEKYLSSDLEFNDHEHEAYAFFDPQKDGSTIIGVMFKEGELAYSIIVHEMVHVVNYIFHFASVKPDLDNDETQAYLSQWVFETIIKTLKKHKIKLV